MNIQNLLAMTDKEFITLVKRIKVLRSQGVKLELKADKVTREDAGEYERLIVSHWKSKGGKSCLRVGRHISAKFPTREDYALHLCKQAGIA